VEPGDDRHPGAVPRPAAGRSRRHFGLGLGGRQRAAVRRAASGGAAPGAQACAPASIPARPRCARCCATSAGVLQPRRGADQRLRGFAAGQPVGHGRGGRAHQRADALPAAGEPVRHVGIGRGTARHVERAGRCYRSRRAPAPAPRFRAAPDRLLHRPFRHGIPGAGRRHHRRSVPDRPLHRRDSRYVWAILAGSAVGLLAQTLGRLYSSAYYACAIRARRCVSPWCACAHHRPRVPVRHSAAAWIGIDPRGAWPGSLHPPASPDGWNSRCCAARSTPASAAPACRGRWSPASGSPQQQQPEPPGE
jgi:hypothetical protein